MTTPSSLSLNYDAVLSTTLFNRRRGIEDQVTTGNVLYYFITKRGGVYKKVSDLGDRLGIPLMYALAPADVYNGYDQLDVNPIDGMTTAFFDWAQMAVPITISGLEQKKNTGQYKLINLLEAKTMQAEMGIQEKMAKGLIQGNGPNVATEITSPLAGTLNPSATFVDPLAKLIAYDPTASVSVGNINQNTYTWWRNQTYNMSSVSTFAGFLKALRNLRNNCSKGPGGMPDLHLLEQQTYELYEAALTTFHQNQSYTNADIPFDNIKFYGKPVVWDEFVPDVATGSTTISKGTWFMVNLKYWGLTVHKGTNFVNTPFERPINQDAKVAHVLWLGAAHVSNRRKQGVAGNIDLTIAS